MSNEYQRAAAWAERNNLDRSKLEDLTGYAAITVYWLLKGSVPPNRKIKHRSNGSKPAPWVWQRFKRACGDVDAELHGRAPGRRFNW